MVHCVSIKTELLNIPKEMLAIHLHVRENSLKQHSSNVNITYDRQKFTPVECLFIFWSNIKTQCMDTI